MQKSTDRTKKILSHITEAIKLVRKEQTDGHDCGTLRNDLERGEHTLRQRLADLRQHNARVEESTKTEAEPQS